MMMIKAVIPYCLLLLLLLLTGLSEYSVQYNAQQNARKLASMQST